MTTLDRSFHTRRAHAAHAALTSRLSPARLAAAGLALSWALLVAASCAPSPRNAPCSNAGDCEKVGPEYRYCLQSRCVECLSSPSCGEGNSCVDGACEIHCKDDRACRQGSKCKDGVLRAVSGALGP